MAFHLFSPEMAKRYGLTEAIMIQYFQMWIERNKVRRKNYFDEHTWTYNSVNSFSSIFFYLSQKQIRASIDSLVEQKVLLKGNYNQTGYDRTSWYCFADENEFLTVKSDHVTVTSAGEDENGEIPDHDDTEAFAHTVKSIRPTGQMEEPYQANGVAFEGQPIPCILQINTQNEEADGAPASSAPPVRKSHEASPQTTAPTERAAEFRRRMMKFRDANPHLYPIPFYEIFFQYWTQPSSDGTLLKFEGEGYFGIDIRMQNFWRRVSAHDKKMYWQEEQDYML